MVMVQDNFAAVANTLSSLSFWSSGLGSELVTFCLSSLREYSSGNSRIEERYPQPPGYSKKRGVPCLGMKILAWCTTIYF